MTASYASPTGLEKLGDCIVCFLRVAVGVVQLALGATVTDATQRALVTLAGAQPRRRHLVLNTAQASSPKEYERKVRYTYHSYWNVFLRGSAGGG